MADEWQVEHNEAARRFEVALGDEQAVLNYYLRDNTLVIAHTGVPRAWEGRGIAASLTRAAFEYARSQRLSIMPVCSYAAWYLHHHPEFRDLSEAD